MEKPCKNICGDFLVVSFMKIEKIGKDFYGKIPTNILQMEKACAVLHGKSVLKYSWEFSRKNFNTEKVWATLAD